MIKNVCYVGLLKFDINLQIFEDYRQSNTKIVFEFG